MIETLKYILLGIVQGFTEPLPISSSGHLIIISDILNVTVNDLSYEIILNFASLLAIILLFKSTIKEKITGFFLYLFKKDSNYKNQYSYCLLILISTIITSVIGLITKDYIESNFTNILTVGISLLFTSLALLLVNNVSNNSREDINILDSVTIGVFQAIALIPGISRSGSTLVAGLSRKLSVKSTLEFSFLLYIPISIGALILSVGDILELTLNFNYVIGFIFSFIFTLIGVKILYNIVTKNNLKYFSIYCFIVGIISIIYSTL